MTFTCGPSSESFEVVFEVDALHAFIELGTEALQKAHIDLPVSKAV